LPNYGPFIAHHPCEKLRETTIDKIEETKRRLDGMRRKKIVLMSKMASRGLRRHLEQRKST
jgi:hypothetical protein